MQYENNRNSRLNLSPIPIKYLPGVTKVLHLFIDTSIKEGYCSDAHKIFSPPCENGSSHIQGIDFDQSYSPVEYADSFIINISFGDMHRLISRILDISN